MKIESAWLRSGQQLCSWSIALPMHGGSAWNWDSWHSSRMMTCAGTQGFSLRIRQKQKAHRASGGCLYRRGSCTQAARYGGSPGCEEWTQRWSLLSQLDHLPIWSPATSRPQMHEELNRRSQSPRKTSNSSPKLHQHCQVQAPAQIGRRQLRAQPRNMNATLSVHTSWRSTCLSMNIRWWPTPSPREMKSTEWAMS